MSVETKIVSVLYCASLLAACASGGGVESGAASGGRPGLKSQSAGGSKAFTSGARQNAVRSRRAGGGPRISGDIVNAVRLSAAQLERQRIMYRQGPGLQDCSGIFHQVLRDLKKRLPWVAGVALPDPGTYRSTRQLGRWYHQQGELQLVRNAANQGQLITPGMVLFYGRPRARYSATNPNALFEPGGIVHMGIVVDVTRDAAGRVTEYGLFHGRSTGKYAKTTRYHKRTHPRYPPFGNGNEPWVAFAPVIPKRPGTDR